MVNMEMPHFTIQTELNRIFVVQYIHGADSWTNENKLWTGLLTQPKKPKSEGLLFKQITICIPVV